MTFYLSPKFRLESGENARVKAIQIVRDHAERIVDHVGYTVGDDGQGNRTVLMHFAQHDPTQP